MCVQVQAVLCWPNSVRTSHVLQICSVFLMKLPEDFMHASVHQANLESVQVRDKKKQENTHV